MRQHGGRATSSRRILLRILFASNGHRTAEELAGEVQVEAPDIHLSTIYRNLEELERLGVVVHSHFGHGPATYHLASSVHGHFVCEECGKLIEVPDTMFSGLAAGGLDPLRVHHRPAPLRDVGTLRRLRYGVSAARGRLARAPGPEQPIGSGKA